MLVELKKKEFDEFAEKQQHNNFQQSSYWAKFMEKDGWHPYFLGYKEKEDILAATVLFSQDTKFFKKRYFYAPRGFLLDYDKEELLTNFTKEVTRFVKEKRGIYLKIDPYLPFHKRDKDGELLEGGKDNTRIVERLEKLGFMHVGDDFKRNMVQPRWLYAIDLQNQSMEDLEKQMREKTRQIVHRNAREGIQIRFLKKEELPQFVAIMKEVSDKYHTLEYTNHYYEDLLDAFPKDALKMVVVELHPKEAIASLEQEIEAQKKSYFNRAFQKDAVLHMNEETYQKKEAQQEDLIQVLEEKKEAYQTVLQEHGETILLGGYFFILYGNEVISLHGGVFEEWKNLDASVTLHYEMIRYAKEQGYNLYNLYEISGDFREDSPMYGSYAYKRNFGGEVVELVGEFDYVLDTFLYSTLKHFFPHYYGIKMIRKEKL